MEIRIYGMCSRELAKPSLGPLVMKWGGIGGEEKCGTEFVGGLWEVIINLMRPIYIPIPNN